MYLLSLGRGTVPDGRGNVDGFGRVGTQCSRLAPIRVNCIDAHLVVGHLTAVGPRRQLDEHVEGDLQIGQLLVRLIQKVCEDGPQDRLVGNDENVLLTLHLHDDRLQTQHQIRVRLAAAVAEAELVLVAEGKVLGIGRSDLLVGQAIADARVQLVKGLPVQTRMGKMGGGLDGALERAGPDRQGIVAVDLAEDGRQGAGKLPATLAQRRIASDPSALVMSRLPMLDSPVRRTRMQTPDSLTRTMKMERGLMCRLMRKKTMRLWR